MAAFDDALNQQNAQLPIPIPDPNRMAFLEGIPVNLRVYGIIVIWISLASAVSV